MASRLLTLSTVAPVAARDEIIAFLDDLLDASAFEDYGPNGLQVAGAEEVSLVERASRGARALEGEPLAFEYGPDSVRSVGIVSGGGAGALQEAIERGLDAIVTGEPSEPAMAEAREAGITFVAGGHYATETFGVRRLGEILAERFGVEHRFVAVPNPV